MIDVEKIHVKHLAVLNCGKGYVMGSYSSLSIHLSIHPSIYLSIYPSLPPSSSPSSLKSLLCLQI